MIRLHNLQLRVRQESDNATIRTIVRVFYEIHTRRELPSQAGLDLLFHGEILSRRRLLRLSVINLNQFYAILVIILLSGRHED